jgi:hypothetical protein
MTDTEAPKPTEPAAETVKPEDKAVPWGAIAVAFVLMAVIAGGVFSWPDWKHLVVPAKMVRVAPEPPPAAANEIAQLRAELAVVADRLHGLENRPAGAADFGPLEQRLSRNEAALRAIQAQPQVPARLTDEVESLGKAVAELRKSSADAAAVLRLADRLDKVEAELREVQARRSSAAALMLAVGQLREALARAMPFDAELRAVKALSPQDGETAPAIEALKPRAITGIPTFATLAGRFQSLAPEIVRAEVLPAGQSWWRETLDRVAALVIIRREDGFAAGDTTAAIIARAEGRLAEGDLAGALAEAEKLTDGPAGIAAPWLADARTRLVADKAVSELSAHVVAQIGARQ